MMTEKTLRDEILLKQQDTASQFAILVTRSLLLVSGGSVIGILTFLGTLLTRNEPAAIEVASRLHSAVIILVFSVVSSILTAVIGYISALAQVFRLHKSKSGIESWLGIHAQYARGLALVMGLIATVLFAWGAILTSLDLGRS